MALLLAGMGLPGTASGTPVSVTANFTQLRMGRFDSASAIAAGLSVNFRNIDVCAGDPTCTTAFNNPASVSPVPLSGNSVTFGYDTIKSPTARMNVFSFAGNPNADVPGTGIQFYLGTFTFTNGQFYPLAYLDFTLTTQSANTALNNQRFSGSIALNSIPGAGVFPFTDASNFAEADYFTIQNVAGEILDMGSVRVFDYNRCLSADPTKPACNTGTADLYGHINSLELDSFSNPTGGAFLNSSTTSDLAPTAAPEPSTLAIVALGLAVLGFSRRKRAS